MPRRIPSRGPRSGLAALAALLLFAPAASHRAVLSDHGDTPLLVGAARHDARITDLFAFTRGANLVLILCTDPTVPPGVASYVFPSDLKLEIAIDNDSAVSFADPAANATYGGTVVDPKKIKEDVKLKVHFDGEGNPTLTTSGLGGGASSGIQLFAGLRDDPFIRGPRIGRNVAAIVIELPLAAVIDAQSTLLVWATAKVPGLEGPFQDLAGRSLRSMFPENDAMNGLHPKHHQKELGVAPDVLIFDTTAPAAYPNGRELIDDVVDLVGDPRVLMNDQPFPTANDVPFLSTFPYLAPAQ